VNKNQFKCQNFPFEPLFQQLTKYSIVGIINTLLSLITYYVFIELYKFNVYKTYTLTNLILIYFSYYLNTKYTFSTNVDLKGAFRYYGVHFFGLLMSLFSISCFDYLNLSSDFIHTVLSIPIRISITFILIKLIVYNKPKTENIVTYN